MPVQHHIPDASPTLADVGAGLRVHTDPTDPTKVYVTVLAGTYGDATTGPHVYTTAQVCVSAAALRSALPAPVTGPAPEPFPRQGDHVRVRDDLRRAVGPVDLTPAHPLTDWALTPEGTYFVYEADEDYGEVRLSPINDRRVTAWYARNLLTVEPF